MGKDAVDLIILDTNIETGETIARPFSEEEITQLQADQEAVKIVEAEAQAKAAARESALAKLGELGLTAEEIAAI